MSKREDSRERKDRSLNNRQMTVPNKSKIASRLRPADEPNSEEPFIMTHENAVCFLFILFYYSFYKLIIIIIII